MDAVPTTETMAQDLIIGAVLIFAGGLGFGILIGYARGVSATLKRPLHFDFKLQQLPPERKPRGTYD